MLIYYETGSYTGKWQRLDFDLKQQQMISRKDDNFKLWALILKKDDNF